MKLALLFGEKKRIVDWDKLPSEFPRVVKYLNKYWEWISWESDKTGDTAHVYFFGEKKEYSLPTDIHGQLFPIPEIELMFGVEIKTSCECGAETTYGQNTSHVFWCPKS